MCPPGLYFLKHLRKAIRAVETNAPVARVNPAVGVVAAVEEVVVAEERMTPVVAEEVVGAEEEVVVVVGPSRMKIRKAAKTTIPSTIAGARIPLILTREM